MKRRRLGLLFVIIIAILIICIICLWLLKMPTESENQSYEAFNSQISQAAPASVSDSTQSSSAIEASSQTVQISLEGLSEKAVAWGAGTQVNENNIPTACISLQEKYGEYGAVFLSNEKYIYLTFDLGYEAGYTEKILDVLKEKDVKATFFLTGSYIKNNEKTVLRILEEGHSIGNHSANHYDMTTISKTEAQNEITQVNALLKEKFDYNCRLFRFPTGVFSEKTLALASNLGCKSIFWSFAYKDWDNSNQPDAQYALNKTVSALHSGGVYLLHPMKTNSEILSSLIDSAREKGFEFASF